MFFLFPSIFRLRVEFIAMCRFADWGPLWIGVDGVYLREGECVILKEVRK